MSSASSSSKKRLIIIISGLVAAAVFYIAWQYGGSEPVRPPVAEKKQEKSAAKSDIQPLATTAPMPTGQPGTQLTTAEEGDVLIDEILRSEKEIPQMARDLAELVKKLNGEAQVNASRHLVNLTSDEDYGLIAGLLVDQKTNPEVIEVLFSDLMNRERTLQLPLFLNILKNPQHPQNEEVENVMQILAGENFGKDMAAWEKWTNEELKTLQAQ
ncbi:hypothetical protein [Prosthecobacter dejongeii]|uniref:Uncharacterized protein n=1 Tax=Prosthecobacter dejongeii TaxID=48465 RepID=A0A7W7YIX1_9BACT|nr:hypothetical protein [Prosthecobacter dejongeii]MBB5037004.1 hypothetical protein [Prosthecobacter dejongeii]